MASMNEPASTTASSATQQTQAEDRAASSMPDITQLSLEHNPDIFTIICCNESFWLALDLNTIKTLLRVCRRARPLLSFRIARFHHWCRKEGLCRPDGSLRIGLTPSDQITLSLHRKNQETTERSWLVAQADKGNAAASYFLARILQVDVARQRYMDKHKEQAIRQRIFRHLENAANAHHTMAMFHLADFYHDGIGVNRNFTKAAELYRDLAERGIPQAQITLGQCYEIGEGVDQEYNTAIEWYSKAADQGSEDGRFHIVFLRGWLSLISHGVEHCDVDAFNHWQEVSTQSTHPIIKPIATHMVGWMHYLGRGTVQDKQKGTKIIRDNKSDEFRLGEDKCLTKFFGTRADSNSHAARKFFNLCRLGSDHDWLCRHLMTVCLYYGFGTTKDQKKAAGNFEQLANEGRSDSQYWIGECCYWGVGVSQDHKKSFEWFCKSANQDNSYGQNMVGFCYYYGIGVTEDYTKAAKWYRKSAEQGNRYGQFFLGECYQFGYGVPKNIDTAFVWFQKSAD
ncbi:uncharacterized protein BJ171DRAFT_574483 [Polychytrium aggregatum]|uniref:uncharacterized protein n=1 Tax=Polychytrium aggregatum TaxID=110093 RepID=UPI0022FE3AE0|nr:uncharacterized protein BJ171DRAFT_574483 [Polychytrium aggregatum]KAI9190744.1 hypothetical protein BJ171DRAFT_574483 [Polychytrium aggregatum]